MFLIEIELHFPLSGPSYIPFLQPFSCPLELIAFFFYYYSYVCVYANMYKYNRPVRSIFVDGGHMILGLSILWTTNKGAQPWERIILLLLAAIGCL